MSEPSLKQNLLSGMISGAGAHGLRLLLNLLLIPLLITYLGAADYGFYLVLLNFAELILALDGGVTIGLTHRLSHAMAIGDDSGLRAQLGLGQRLYLGVAALLTLVGLAAIPWLTPTFHLSGPHLAVAPACLAITIFDGGVNLLGCYFNAVLKAHCRHQITNTAGGFHGVAANLLSLGLVMARFGLVEILAARLFISVVKNVWLAAQLHRLDSQALRWQTGFSWRAFGDLFQISGSALVQRLSAFLAHRTASFVIAAFLSLNAVAIFGVVERIFGQITQLCLVLSDGLFPAFTRLSSANEADKSRFFFLRASALLHFMATLPTLAVAAMYPQAFHLLSGGGMPFEPTIPIACLLGAVSWSIVIQLPASNYLFASGMHRFQTLSALITALLNAATGLLLVKPLGLLGVAIGIAVPHLIQHQAVTIPLARRRLGVSARAYARAVYGANAAPLLAGGLTFLLGRLAIEYAGFPPLWTLAAFGATGSLAASVLWLSLCASPQERALLLTTMLRPFPRLGRLTRTGAL